MIDMIQEDTTIVIKLVPLKAKVELFFDPDSEQCTSIWYDLNGNASSKSVSNLSQEEWSKFLISLDAGVAPFIS